jgi:hypothetical protein
MDTFARELSKTVGVVLSLVSADEDEVLCNFCLAGKDYSFFKIRTGAKRSPKAQEPVAKKLALLKEFLTADQQKELLASLADTRNILFSADILRTFCQALVSAMRRLLSTISSTVIIRPTWILPFTC